MSADPGTPNLGEVRAAHRLDEAALDRWLAANVEGYRGPLSVSQFKGGASNPTYLLSAGGARYVLRKKPPGLLLASAHQVDREYRVMKALGEVGFPVPRMRALCEDDAVIGTSFYVMDFLEGRIFRDARLPGLEPAERRAIYDELNAVLARLHAIDPVAVGLGDFGRPGNYFERQIGRFIKQYRGAETETMPAMEALIEQLPGRIPAEGPVTIAHGDYRLENVMFHPTEPRIIAVLDWELSTLGHPLADLAYTCILWHSRSESWGTLDGIDLAAAGIPTEEQHVAAYCRRTGRDGIEDFPFYLAFSLFRLASISQGVFKRNLDGIGTSDPSTDNSGARTLAETALAVLNR
ncbi:phosphotransferase [Phenylobacterium sp. LH3H17]|uniref:phosphotransferase n=1 Tax=Phenylobacterium sp. LH3H17 TaxID=2903901 RepID=UPI0020CA0C6A|nr:phosphotransferase [Phenylobacterium sp. LH3H17]UTP40347.1 phosphotransferase [Phenylobacterium sp. LH3H17]